MIGMPPSFVGFGGAMRPHTPPSDVLNRSFDRLNLGGVNVTNGMNGAMNRIPGSQGYDIPFGVGGISVASNPGPATTNLRHQL
jgi:hypothetical protein